MSINNIAELITKNINGGTFIGITTETIPTLKGGKKNPMLGCVTKRTEKSSVMVFQNKNSSSYGNMVQRRLEKEGMNVDFELKPRKLGVRVPNTPFIEHKGEYYIEVIFLKSGKTSYKLDNKDIKKEDVIGLPTVTSYDNEQGGLEEKVIIRSYKVSSIKEITINKQTFTDLTFNYNS